MHADIASYHQALDERDRAICDRLAREISRCLPEADSKVWHAHPVWFLDGNPVVGYSKLKGGIRLLFWSGQSFGEPDLNPEGKFRAAEARFTAADDIPAEDLSRWLAKARDIQWDYRNIVKRRGVLEKLTDFPG